MYTYKKKSKKKQRLVFTTETPQLGQIYDVQKGSKEGLKKQTS